MAEFGSSAADELLAVALARGATFEEAAREAGLSERTAFRRNSDPKFRELVASIRRQVLDVAVGKLLGLAGQAVGGMAELMGEQYPAATRLAACRAVLEFSAKLREQVEFEGRLADVEDRLNGTHSAAA